MALSTGGSLEDGRFHQVFSWWVDGLTTKKVDLVCLLGKMSFYSALVFFNGFNHHLITLTTKMVDWFVFSLQINNSKLLPGYR